jgi:histidinol-phosphate/aromatic aminotransferase/cobyric acid decarboxylase-like protein
MKLIMICEGRISCYIGFIREGRETSSFQYFSKVYGLAGVRGWVRRRAHELIATLIRLKNVRGYSLAQIAACGDEDEAFMRQTVETNRAAREYLYVHFPDGIVPCEEPKQFVLVELGEQMETIVKELMEKGVIIRRAAVQFAAFCAECRWVHRSKISG